MYHGRKDGKVEDGAATREVPDTQIQDDDVQDDKVHEDKEPVSETNVDDRALVGVDNDGVENMMQ